MTRGRDSTNAGARSPRLAITLRGLKILEHPKTRPELWGVMVPWVRVNVSQRAHLVDEAGAPINAQRLYGGGWSLPEHDRDVARRMARRAKRRVVDTWQFHFVETSMVSTQDKWGLVATPVFLILAICALVVVPLVDGTNRQLFATWHGIVLAAMIGLPLGFVVLLFSGMLHSGVCAARHGARRVVYAPEAVELEFDDGRIERVEWRSIQGVRSYVGAIAITSDHGRVYWLRSWRYLFLFAAHVDRLDRTRARRYTARAIAVRLFLFVQSLALIGVGAMYALRLADPLTPTPSAVEMWLLIGVLVPLVVLVPGFLFHQLDRRVLRPRRRVRARALRRRFALPRESAHAR